MDYDLLDLELVKAIAECGTLTKAAERVSLAPSSACHRLRKLEATFGVSLFARHYRGMKLTQAGRVMLSRIKYIFASFQVLEK